MNNDGIFYVIGELGRKQGWYCLLLLPALTLLAAIIRLNDWRQDR